MSRLPQLVDADESDIARLRKLKVLNDKQIENLKYMKKEFSIKSEFKAKLPTLACDNPLNNTHQNITMISLPKPPKFEIKNEFKKPCKQEFNFNQNNIINFNQNKIKFENSV